MNKKLSIIILNYNGYDDTVLCLKSLRKSSSVFTTYILDNGSGDNSFEKLQKIVNQNEIVIRSEENLGFAEGNNYLAKVADKDGCDYLLLINNDMTIEPDMVDKLIKATEKTDKFGAVSPLIYYMDKKRIWYAGGQTNWFITGTSYSYEKLPNNLHLQPTQFCSGGCMLIDNSLYKKLGGFDKRFFAYNEDSDLSERIKKAGNLLYFEPEAVVYHKVNATLGSRNPLQIYYHIRNKLLFLSKNGRWYHFPTVILYTLYKDFLWNIMGALIKPQKGKWKRVMGAWLGLSDFILGNFGKCQHKII
ncbi:MAG: Glycosyltransferase [Berkelbacteria bacterium GW2011_GWA2_35_9]|uniref:Glycosyltransferase n=1 Tax=Berkelbacteria bacterium GW2011_GWA2_35_9 TaxID=1618333 RepID=A0A0G0DJL5_9BACT|nr:MAG: Glycosyltransferase [Berkelbacteria bacterium GW2011_GWA2_35_9]